MRFVRLVVASAAVVSIAGCQGGGLSAECNAAISEYVKTRLTAVELARSLGLNYVGPCVPANKKASPLLLAECMHLVQSIDSYESLCGDSEAVSSEIQRREEELK